MGALMIIRSLPTQTKNIYLTFDDGPDPVGTPAVLDVLKAKNAKSTFFLIAEKARAYPAVVERIQREGHAIGNHSLDHLYRRYFSGRRKLGHWIADAEQVFAEMGIGELT